MVETSNPVDRYESRQSGNTVSAWLHSRRYERARAILDGVPGTPSVVDIGAGCARLYWHLAGGGRRISYLGIEPHEAMARAAEHRYGGHTGFAMACGRAEVVLPSVSAADLVFAFETLEHVTLSTAEAILDAVAKLRPRLFVCTVPVELGAPILAKNVARALMGYPREYTWRETAWAAIGRLDKLTPHTQWHKGFDWRRLLSAVASRFSSVRVESLPVSWLPLGLGTHVMMIASP